MPQALVKCSMPDCQEAATLKVAAPWNYGRFSELKTFGYACPTHAEPLVAKARQRPAPHLSAGETMDEFGAYPL